MVAGLPLDRMTAAEKLEALEEIWESLSQTPSEVPAPSWHGEVLADRERSVRNGTSGFTDWEPAKKDIRDATR